MKKSILTLLLIFLASCGYQTVKVERDIPRKELVYYAPVKGIIREDERGYFIKTRCGEFFRAVEGGKVVYSGRDLDNYGWVIIVEQKDGNVAVYGKVGKPWVNQGERVKIRQVLGKVGMSKGNCGIHFEVRGPDGNPVKPLLR